MWRSQVFSFLTNPVHLLIPHDAVDHIAENCSSEQRLCYNCRQPGHESSACPSPRTVAAKQCYSCGGVGHIQAECPNLRVRGGNQKCYVCWLLIFCHTPCSLTRSLVRIVAALGTSPVIVPAAHQES
ncbi:hypothetical protein F5I97DRAFT_889490 [Phlebopus sp. FC_14]|nr:hypothetical protein F5I97DRAFT_889490 [Phlebopus sp. FC_14]